MRLGWQQGRQFTHRMACIWMYLKDKQSKQRAESRETLQSQLHNCMLLFGLRINLCWTLTMTSQYLAGSLTSLLSPLTCEARHLNWFTISKSRSNRICNNRHQDNHIWKERQHDLQTQYGMHTRTCKLVKNVFITILYLLNHTSSPEDSRIYKTRWACINYSKSAKFRKIPQFPWSLACGVFAQGAGWMFSGSRLFSR